MIAVLDLIPLIGATIGAVLVALVSVFVGFPGATIIWGGLGDRLPAGREQDHPAAHSVARRRCAAVPRLVAVLFGGTLFGVIGALMAAPAVASAQIVVREILRQRRALHITTNKWGLDRMETVQRR